LAAPAEYGFHCVEGLTAMTEVLAIPAPFISSVMNVEPQWIDYNGHLNVAYYNVLFDRAVDEFYELIGVGPDYLKRSGHSTVVAETHVRYLREIHLDTPVRVRVQLLDHDGKRMHVFEELVHASDGWLSATAESMTLHIDMAAKKVAPWPADVMAAFARMKAAHGTLPVPVGIGRQIGMPQKR
jgi:acyl-CoA thioester hydrolase